jgi:hypothetical protein
MRSFTSPPRWLFRIALAVSIVIVLGAIASFGRMLL